MALPPGTPPQDGAARRNPGAHGFNMLVVSTTLSFRSGACGLSGPTMRAPTNAISGHGTPAPIAPAAFNLPRQMCTIRRTHEHGRSLVLVVRMPPQEEQHTDVLTARLAGMLLGALLRDVLAREACTRFPARCFGSSASCLGSPTADTLRVVKRSYTAVFQPHRAPRLCPR